jgi:hypothetical protein
VGAAVKRAWIPCVLTTALAVMDFALTPTVVVGLGAPMLICVAMVGGVVSSRVPANPSGWLLSVIALSLAGAVAGNALYEHEGAVVGAWATTWVWVPGMVSVAVFGVVFPTGRPLSGSWRWLLWTSATAGVALIVGSALAIGEFEDYPGVRNPYGVTGGAEVAAAGFALLVVSVLGSIAALVVRFRRSHGVQRQQMKWVASGAAFFPVAFSGAGFSDDAGFLLLLAGLLIIALTVAVAILRYRLYDIDVVINRALVYAALTVTLAATYLATVLLTQLVLPERSNLAIAASTLAAAGLMRPARRRIQETVDRRFFRSRYDAAQALAAFGTRLRDEVSLEAVDAELRDAIARTLQPAHVSVWLRQETA